MPWSGRARTSCAPIFATLIDEAKAADREEHWRLLYVGLTRAEERLVIAGVKPQAGRAADELARRDRPGAAVARRDRRSRSMAGACAGLGYREGAAPAVAQARQGAA